MFSSFLCPTEIHLGIGSLKKVEEIVMSEGFKKALIVTDKGIRNAGIVAPLEKLLQEVNLAFSIFDGVEPNPTQHLVEGGFAFLQQEAPDVLIAIGGGSSIDTAKAFGILATNEGRIADFKGVGKVEIPILPVIAIPTTAGTGSEVTTVTVLTDTEQKVKYSIGGRNVAARWAIIDAELTVTMPPHVTAATGIDALTHAVESYTSKLSYSVTDALAREAISLIGRHLRTAVYQGENLEARSKMLEASLIAGLAFNNAKLGFAIRCATRWARILISHMG
nr:iron-containing alcohol dehydrogenase [Aneurinibacillus tyrosinisolvens]